VQALTNVPQSFPYTKSPLGAQWRPLYITLLTLLVFSEMSYASLSFCTLQDKRIFYIYVCVCVCVYIYIFFLLFTCKFEPMTHALFEQVQRDRRVVFDPAKDTPSPESWKLPQTTPTDFAVSSEMSCVTFSFCTLQDIVYIFVVLFTCKFKPMTRALFYQVQRDRRVVFEGRVWDATLTPAKFVGGLKWPASWLQTEKP
jgi:hypothetical protein